MGLGQDHEASRGARMQDQASKRGPRMAQQEFTEDTGKIPVLQTRTGKAKR